MPRTKLSEYSTTNSDNTDIENINIAEGCAPSGINNAIRELMVHLKEFQTGASGDAFTFAGGTLMSGTNTISGAAIISGNINSSGTNTFSGSNVMSFSGGSSASPSIYFASDTNTGIFSPAADTIAFTEGGVESMRIDSSGNFGLGVTPSAWQVNNRAIQLLEGYASISSNNSQGCCDVAFNCFNGGSAATSAWKYTNTGVAVSLFQQQAGAFKFLTAASGTAGNTISFTQAMTLTSGGTFAVGITNPTGSSGDAVGIQLTSSNYIQINRSAGGLIFANRRTNDGVLITLLQDDTDEGTISVSGTTVSYNGGHLSRWAQMPGTKDDTLVKGTVMSNLDEMNVYIAPTTYWTEEDELPEGVNVGDVKIETHTVDNEQLNKVKVSDVEGDVNVAGVFVNWTHDDAHQVDEINMAMTGDMIIRIAQGVVVQKGDLLMSAGDGTAKPQGDDIVRSKTVAKVTSNHVTCTYADGSYCVPCVLMAC